MPLIIAAVILGLSIVSAQPALSPAPLPVRCHTAELCFRYAVEAAHDPADSPQAIQQRIADFQRVQQQFPGTVWAKRAGLRLGLFLKEHAPEDAVARLRAALQDLPLLQDYIRYWLAESLVRAHRPEEAAVLFGAVRREEGRSRLAREAHYAEGHAWVAAGDCKQAVDVLRAAVRRARKSGDVPRALTAIGRCELLQRHHDRAYATLREVWRRFPAEPEGVEAEELMAQLPQATRRDPTVTERYQQALSLYRAGAYARAISGLRAYLKDVSKGPNRDEARYKLAMAYAKLKQYGKAEPVFRDISRSSSKRRAEGVVWLGRSYLRQGKGKALLAMQRDVRSLKLSGDHQALIHIFAGVWLNDHGRDDEAIRAFGRAADAARSRSRQQDALRRLSWIYYERQDYTRVIHALTKLLAVSRDGEMGVSAQYWMARAHEHLHQPAKANRLFRTLADGQPMTYYGQLARARLYESPSPTSVDVAAPVTHRPSAAPVTQTRRYQRTMELVRLELFAEAAQELDALLSREASDPENLTTLITLAQRAGAYDVGIRLAIRQLGASRHVVPVSTNRSLWYGAYPVGYVPIIQQHAPSGLDPYLVAGLIREESRYQARAVSPVGALGLMQLMPSTAKKVARDLGEQEPVRTDLFHAETNIRLGTSYIAELLELFQGNVVHAVAAYNAGPHVVKRWMAQMPGLASDEFVERISYRETRRYVKRVLGSYRIYRMLMADACATTSLDRMC